MSAARMTSSNASLLRSVLTPGQTSASLLLILAALRKHLQAVIAGIVGVGPLSGFGFGSQEQLAAGSLLTGWFYYTIISWLSSRFWSLYAYFDPVNKLLNYAWIDSHHATNDESYRWLAYLWLRHPRSGASRNFQAFASTNIVRAKRQSYTDRDLDVHDNIGRAGIPGHRTESGDVTLAFQPRDVDTMWLFNNGTLFRLTHRKSERSGMVRDPQQYDGIQIRCFSRTRAPLVRFLLEAHQAWKDSQETRTTLQIMVYNANSFGLGGRGWTLTNTRNGRSLASVILPQATKDGLVADLSEFLSTEKWYTDRGIAWKRGYMLYGPPGCGKSSTIQALASEFDLPVYILPVASTTMSDELLFSAVRDIQSRCILVMEDIDVWAKSRRAKENQQFVPRGEQSSLSALLNVIDGLEASEGRIIVMTTNKIDDLDPALVRPGRIDCFIEYRRATKEEAGWLFVDFYWDWQLGLTSAGGPDQGDEASDEVERLADVWCSFIEDGEYSIAELQGMLLGYKRSPHAAVENMPKWISETAAGRRHAQLDEHLQVPRMREQRYMLAQRAGRARGLSRRASFGL